MSKKERVKISEYGIFQLYRCLDSPQAKKALNKIGYGIFWENSDTVSVYWDGLKFPNAYHKKFLEILPFNQREPNPPNK